MSERGDIKTKPHLDDLLRDLGLEIPDRQVFDAPFSEQSSFVARLDSLNPS